MKHLLTGFLICSLLLMQACKKDPIKNATDEVLDGEDENEIEVVCYDCDGGNWPMEPPIIKKKPEVVCYDCDGGNLPMEPPIIRKKPTERIVKWRDWVLKPIDSEPEWICLDCGPGRWHWPRDWVLKKWPNGGGPMIHPPAKPNDWPPSPLHASRRSTASRDIFKALSMEEDRRITRAGRRFSARYSLSEETGVRIARSLHQFQKIGNRPSRTMADYQELSRGTLGLDLSEIKAGLMKEKKGLEALDQVADHWQTSPENARQILERILFR